MNFELMLFEVIEKIAKHLTCEDYAVIGHDMQDKEPERTVPTTACTKCGCTPGSAWSLNRCGFKGSETGGYMDLKSAAIQKLKERVGVIGIPIRERRIV